MLLSGGYLSFNFWQRRSKCLFASPRKWRESSSSRDIALICAELRASLCCRLVPGLFQPPLPGAAPFPFHPTKKTSPVPALIVSLLVLVLCQLLGEWLVRSLGIPLPGALIGLVLLTVALVVLGRVPQALGKVSGGLLRNMMLLLAPAVVGLIDNMARVREEWLPFLVACVAGALITLAVTGIVLQRLLRTAAPHAGEQA